MDVIYLILLELAQTFVVLPLIIDSFPTYIIMTLEVKIHLVDAKISLIGSNLWIIDKNLPDADLDAKLVAENIAHNRRDSRCNSIIKHTSSL
jgi:hypothetical protein